MRNLGGGVQNTLGPANQAATNQIHTEQDIQNQRKLKVPRYKEDEEKQNK